MTGRQPRLTVDVIIELPGGREAAPPSSSGDLGKSRCRIVLVRRKFPPPGWALPGGFVDRGETLEAAAVREAREETGLEVTLVRQFHTYSDPRRDPRGHTVSTVFIGTAQGEPRGGDDAAEAAGFARHELPDEIAFDHRDILEDFFNGRYEAAGCSKRFGCKARESLTTEAYFGVRRKEEG